VFKVESWHVTMAKLHNLLMCHAINRALVVHGVVVVCNEEGFSIEGDFNMKILVSKDFVGFKCSTFDVK